MAEFFHMGGYAAFVWSAYGIAIMLMGGLAIVSLYEFLRNKRLVEEFERLEGARPRRAAMPMSDGTSGETRP